MPEEKPASKSKLIVRVALFAILIVALILAISHGKLRSECKRAIKLYDEATAMDEVGDITARAAKLKEAEDILEAVIQKPLSAIKLRGPATESLALVKTQIAEIPPPRPAPATPEE